MNLFQALDTGYNILKSTQKNSYKIDTEILLSDSLNITIEELILNLKKAITLKHYYIFLSALQLFVSQNESRPRLQIKYIYFLHIFLLIDLTF